MKFLLLAPLSLLVAEPLFEDTSLTTKSSKVAEETTPSVFSVVSYTGTSEP